MKSTFARVGAGAALVAALSLSAPLAAHAVTYEHYYGFSTLAKCQTEQHKPAYNNSFVRVTKACFKDTDGHAGYAFNYATL
jgi:hypothetical protein